MKAGKMTNEELAHNLHATIPFLTKEARHVTDADEIMREAATRLLNQGEIAVNDAEIARLRSIVKELADVLDESNKTECEQWCKCSCEHGDDKNGCETMCKKRALVKKAREVIGGAE